MCWDFWIVGDPWVPHQFGLDWKIGGIKFGLHQVICICCLIGGGGFVVRDLLKSYEIQYLWQPYGYFGKQGMIVISREAR